MKNLNRILNIWDNLEKFNLNESPIRNIKKLLGYSDGKTKLNYLLNKLKEESSTYNSNEIEEYSRITGVLTEVSEYICLYELQDNLTYKDILSTAHQYKQNYGSKTKITDSFIKSISPKLKNNTVLKSLRLELPEIYERANSIGDVVIKTNSGFSAFKVDDKDAYVVHTTSEIKTLGELAKTNSFLARVYACCYLMHQAGADFTKKLFISKKYYKLTPKGDKVEVNIGELKRKTTINENNTFTLKQVNKDDMNFYKASININKTEVHIMCV